MYLYFHLTERKELIRNVSMRGSQIPSQTERMMRRQIQNLVVATEVHLQKMIKINQMMTQTMKTREMLWVKCL